MLRQPWVPITIACLTAAGCTVQSTTIPLPDSGPGQEDSGPAQIDAGTDAGPACPAGELLCATGCTRVAADPLNCGSCGNACPTGTGCAAGRCDCALPRIACDGVCLDPSEDIENCGSCGNVCGSTEMCSDGECIVACSDPEVVCANRDESGGTIQVCADLTSDPVNCGGCNTRCAGGSVCTDSRCQCPSGQINCGGTCLDPSADPENCGSCRVSCGPGGTCEGGRCTTCGTDHIECSGRCVDAMNDRFNCGSCGRACGTGEVCSGGLCSCTGSMVDCGSGCTDLTSDAANCGTCGIDCGPGGVCASGTCTCSGTLTLCTAGCRDLDTDPANCGACDSPCPVTGSICTSGTCACPTGMTECGGACVNLASDRAHCGACDAACPGMQVCVASACTDVPPPPNDTCAGAIALTGASGTRTSDTLLGASQESSGDCGGAEVYYSITITQRSVLYLDTFGTSFDTLIAHRGTTCSVAATSCVDDSCTTAQSQIAVLVDAGTHFFSVHAAASATPGPLSLRWQAVAAAGGTNTRITASGTFTGTTSGSGARTATCTTADGPEDGYWFTLCPGETRTVGANTCTGTLFDSVVHTLGPAAPACDDDGCGAFLSFQSSLSFSASGPGLWEIFVDGWDSFETGAYSLEVTGL